MRVQYSLPGFLPDVVAPTGHVGTEGTPFRSLLTALPVSRKAGWEELLRLDRVPVTSSTLAPPSAPDGAQTAAGAESRVRWSEMLDRQVGSYEQSESADPDFTNTPAAKSIGRMLTLLLGFRDLENSMASRQLAEPES